MHERDVALWECRDSGVLITVRACVSPGDRMAGEASGSDLMGLWRSLFAASVTATITAHGQDDCTSPRAVDAGCALLGLRMTVTCIPVDGTWHYQRRLPEYQYVLHPDVTREQQRRKRMQSRAIMCVRSYCRQICLGRFGTLSAPPKSSSCYCTLVTSGLWFQ